MKKIKEIFKLKNFINLNALKEGEVTNEEEILRLDAQGRHRSEWCYAAYDGRKEKGIPHGCGFDN